MKFKMSRPKTIKGSICPLKRQAIFATNFTEVFLHPKMQELIFDENSTINGTIFQLTLNAFSRRINTLTAIFVNDKRSKIDDCFVFV